VQTEKGGIELWTAEASPAPGKIGTLVPFLRHEERLFFPQYSPDGRWIAYAGRGGSAVSEIFVESVPPGAGRWQITSEGGTLPAWRGDGKELYYQNGSGVWTVPVVSASGSFAYGKAQKLFDLPPGASYRATRSGERFLAGIPEKTATAMTRTITVDTGWRLGVPAN
jgi:hypothetical protein